MIGKYASQHSMARSVRHFKNMYMCMYIAEVLYRTLTTEFHKNHYAVDTHYSISQLCDKVRYNLMKVEPFENCI